MESDHIAGDVKKELKMQYESLNPAELKRAITRLQGRLIRLTTLKTNSKKGEDFVYNFHEATSNHFV